jgi:hypothetical protein
MLFDRLCKLAESAQKSCGDYDLRAACRDAKLFVFDKPAHELLKEHDPALAMAAAIGFWMPFSVVAVEDTYSCVLLVDTVKNQIGWEHPRVIFEIRPMYPCDESVAIHDTPESAQRYHQQRDMFLAETGLSVQEAGKIVVLSKLRLLQVRVNAEKPGLFDSLAEVDKTSYVLWPDGKLETVKMQQENRDSVQRSGVVAIEEICYANSPSRFILETSPARLPTHIGPKLLRAHQRPQYTLLEPGKIRKLLKLPEHVAGTHASPEPHPRRRHVRTLRSEKFTQKHGQTINIPASWVGPSEIVQGNKRYRVRLDL